VVEPGCDARALATLSLSALGASPRAAEYLEQLGVRTGATLARLSPLAVRRRLGSEGERLVRLTRAEPEPRPERFCPPDQPSARCELEPPLPPGEALLFLVKRLLDELTLRLAGRGLAVGELRLTLAFEGGLEVIEELMLPRPLVTTPPLLAMLQERLLNPALPQSPDSDDDLPPPRLTELEARVTRTAPVPRAQLSLLHRQEVELERLAELLARLTNVLGRDQVFTAELVPTHLPEESWRRGASGESLETGEQRLETGEQRLEISPRPALVLPAPLLLEGELIQGDELRWEGGSGVIAYIWGPERLRGRWWAMPFDRDYYVVDLVEGARIWVFRERGSTTLRLQGVFD
jgi:protein ImuB